MIDLDPVVELAPFKSKLAGYNKDGQLTLNPVVRLSLTMSLMIISQSVIAVVKVISFASFRRPRKEALDDCEVNENVQMYYAQLLASTRLGELRGSRLLMLSATPVELVDCDNDSMSPVGVYDC